MPEHDATIPDPAFAERVTRYLAADLDAADLDALGAMLSRDASARRYFRLACSAASFVAAPATNSELETRNSKLLNPLKPDPSPPIRGRAKVRVPGVPHRHASLQRGMVYACAAALLLAATAVAIYLFAFTPRPETRDPRLDSPVATLTDATGVVWSTDPLNPGDEIAPQTIRTEGGTIELMLKSGAMATVIGRSELRLDSPTSVSMTRGMATFDCPPDARGFTVHLPGGARVVDLGTRFTVWITDGGATRVGVIEGVVELSGPSDAAPLRLVTGQGGSIDAAGRSQTRPAFAGDIPLGNLFDDPAGTPLDLAIASDTYQATAEFGDLGVVSVVHGGDEPGTVQTIAQGVRIDLSPLGWTNAGTPRPPVNDAWGNRPNEGGLRTLGRSAAANLPRTEDGVGMHTNLLLALDVAAIRRAGGIADDAPIRFIADRAGVGDTAVGHGAVHIAAVAFDSEGVAVAMVNGSPVGVDAIGGTIRFTGPIPPAMRNAAASFDLPIPASARYLTLIAASAGVADADHAVLSGARLVVSDPATHQNTLVPARSPVPEQESEETHPIGDVQ